MTSLSKSFQLSPLRKVSIKTNSLLARSHLARRWLGEPQSPLMHQGVLDIEVVLIMEDSGLLITTWALSLVLSIWGDGYSLEVNLLTFGCCHVCDCAYVTMIENSKGFWEMYSVLYW